MRCLATDHSPLTYSPLTTFVSPLRKPCIAPRISRWDFGVLSLLVAVLRQHENLCGFPTRCVGLGHSSLLKAERKDALRHVPVGNAPAFRSAWEAENR